MTCTKETHKEWHSLGTRIVHVYSLIKCEQCLLRYGIFRKVYSSHGIVEPWKSQVESSQAMVEPSQVESSHGREVKSSQAMIESSQVESSLAESS